MKNIILENKQDYEMILHSLFKNRDIDEGNKAFTISFSSITKKEGVSTVTAAIAKYLASTYRYKVLLIKNYTKEHVDKSIKSLDALNIEKTDLNDIVSDYKESGLNEISIYNTDHFGFFYSSEWRGFWDGIIKNFDVVFVDASSFQTVIPIVWNKVTDQTILVIDSQKLTSQVLSRFKVEAENNGYNINGFILNNRRYPIPDFIYNMIIRR